MEGSPVQGVQQITKGLLKLKFTGAARKLIATGAVPAAGYGASCGIAPSSLHRLRLLAARATAGAGTACCLTTALAIDGKPFADPGVRLRCEAILTWVRILRKFPEARSANLETVWKRTLLAYRGLNGKSPWKAVRGPLGATIAALMEAGWDPLEPLCWTDEHGDEWDMYSEEFGLGELKARLAETFQAHYWRKATTSRHGADLAGGVDFTMLRKLLRRLECSKQFTKYNLMMCIATGSSWSEERLAKAGKKGNPVCYRCGEVGITDWHTYWECPALAKSEVPEIAGSQHLVPWTANMRESWGETFWLRGLVQRSRTDYNMNGGTEVFCLRFDDNGKPQRYAKYTTWQEAADSNLDFDFSVEHLHAFTDGSGGKGSSDRRLRACGWSAVFMRSPSALGIAFWGELPGTVQTVPRAELAGAHFAITMAAGLGHKVSRMSVYIDCSLVTRGLAGGKLKCFQSPTLASAWTALWRTQESASFVLEGVKVRAHMDTDPGEHVQ